VVILFFLLSFKLLRLLLKNLRIIAIWP